MSKLDRTDGGLLTLGIVGALAAAGSLRRGSAGKEVKRKPRDPWTDPKLPGTHEGSECPECGGMGHTIGFEGRRKVRHPCETCPPVRRGSATRDHAKTKRVLVNELVQQIQARHPEVSERAIRGKARQFTKMALINALETLRSDGLVVIPPMASWRGQVGSANDYNWQDDWKAIQEAFKKDQEHGWSEEDWWALQGGAISKRLGSNVGLNADWSVSAWHLGPSQVANMQGGEAYLLDNEDDSYSIVRRYYVDEGYDGISAQDRRDHADGGNDAVVEIASFHEYPAFPQVMRWLDANMAKLNKGK